MLFYFEKGCFEFILKTNETVVKIFCRYLLTKNDSMPGALWIWDIPKLRHVALILHDAPIKISVWDPRQARLALCTGTNKVLALCSFKAQEIIIIISKLDYFLSYKVSCKLFSHCLRDLRCLFLDQLTLIR